MPDFDWNSLPPPERIAWPIYPADSPARRDEMSTEAFNEDATRAAFGDECIDWLTGGETHSARPFRGDWWWLALLWRSAAHAERIDQERKGSNRFKAFTTAADQFRKQGITVHLEQAYLGYAHLEHANFSDAHLEHAYLGGAYLEHANLCRAHLEQADLYQADMERASLWEAHLKHADLWKAHLEHANLREAHLEHADLSDAYLEHADLREAHLEHANLSESHLEHANLGGAHLEHADLGGAHLEHATLWEADLDHANVRGASGILFDDCRVQRLNIEGNASDPWSVLRRTYTGPMYFVHLLLVAGFILPYAARIPAPTTARAVDAPAWWEMLGGVKDWWWFFVPTAFVILLYNILRGYLTLNIGILRDQADRVDRTPTLEEYYGPCHPLAREKAGWRRIWAIWIERVSRWCRAKKEDIDIAPWRWRWKHRGLLNPLPVVGAWRLHRIAQVLFWVSLISVLIHVGTWLLITTVPK